MKEIDSNTAVSTQETSVTQQGSFEAPVAESSIAKTESEMKAHTLTDTHETSELSSVNEVNDHLQTDSLTLSEHAFMEQANEASDHLQTDTFSSSESVSISGLDEVDEHPQAETSEPIEPASPSELGNQISSMSDGSTTESGQSAPDTEETAGFSEQSQEAPEQGTEAPLLVSSESAQDGQALEPSEASNESGEPAQGMTDTEEKTSLSEQLGETPEQGVALFENVQEKQETEQNEASNESEREAITIEWGTERITIYPERVNFANEYKLEKHFEKHGHEFGAMDASDYLEKAQSFISQPDNQSHIRENGDILFFDSRTGQFAVVANDCTTIRTYFNPGYDERLGIVNLQKAQEYWENQTGRGG